ncbi:hypothetical protein [Nonlabens sp. SY33080]|uniref:hypothetical protein n=1 Tax=Nonlabens sp. SY33080 TaxID=2719911 RepID=UPI001428899A|nr:hypothetical protein [Nonlabens sp. SY33080]
MINFQNIKTYLICSIAFLLWSFSYSQNLNHIDINFQDSKLILNDLQESFESDREEYHLNSFTRTVKIDSPSKLLCDLCSCTTSSGSSGFGTLQNLNFVGIRFIYQNFESKDGIFNNSPSSEEQFYTYQAWANIPISKKIALNAVIPYQDLSRKRVNGNENINGVGDITIIGWYKHVLYKRPEGYNVVFENKDPSGHQFQYGLGIKLPTGKFEEQLVDRVNPGFQVGTGSTDFLISVMHNYSAKKWGIKTQGTYYLKSENKNEYRFGNQLSASSNVFYNIAFAKASLNPYLGISTDLYGSIRQFDEEIKDTNGYVFNATLGAEFNFDRFNLGASYTLPVAQELFAGNVESQQRVSIYLNVLWQ